MKTLYLLRHAHTERQSLGGSDYDRALDEQGLEEADALGQYLKDKNLTFDYAMCSAAIRAQETLEPLRSYVTSGQIEVSTDFYNITEDQILKNIQNVPDNVERLLYIGHNPGIAFAILRLALKVPPDLTEGVKPGTLVGFQIPINSWSELNWKSGEVIDMFHPTLGSEDTPEPMQS